MYIYRQKTAVETAFTTDPTSSPALYGRELSRDITLERKYGKIWTSVPAIETPPIHPC